MLKEKSIEYEYREYTRQPLSEDEIRDILSALDAEPVDILRKRDPAYKALGLVGKEPRDRLIALMAEHPTLVQRPIGVFQGKAVVGRPPERLLELV